MNREVGIFCASKGSASALRWLFIAELGRPSEAPLRERLRDVWRDWTND